MGAAQPAVALPSIVDWNGPVLWYCHACCTRFSLLLQVSRYSSVIPTIRQIRYREVVPHVFLTSQPNTVSFRSTYIIVPIMDRPSGLLNLLHLLPAELKIIYILEPLDPVFVLGRCDRYNAKLYCPSQQDSSGICIVLFGDTFEDRFEGSTFVSKDGGQRAISFSDDAVFGMSV